MLIDSKHTYEVDRHLYLVPKLRVILLNLKRHNFPPFISNNPYSIDCHIVSITNQISLYRSQPCGDTSCPAKLFLVPTLQSIPWLNWLSKPLVSSSDNLTKLGSCCINLRLATLIYSIGSWTVDQFNQWRHKLSMKWRHTVATSNLISWPLWTTNQI